MYKTSMESFRLSPQQRHLCALQQAEEPFPYRMRYAVRLQGLLDVSRLRGSLKQLVERHEILQTSFPRLPGLTLPMQVINVDMPLSFVIHNCSSLSSREQEQALSQLREVQRDRSFPLEGGPLWQVTLVICDIEQYWLLWDLNGLCADAQTCHVLLLELSQLYASKEFGEELEEPLQYADLAEWQYQLLESAETATGREYWCFLEHAELDAISLPYELPTDGISPFTPRSLAVDLSPAELAQLGVLAQQLDVAPAALLLACWGTVLSRLSMQTDLLIGTGYSGRNYEQLASAVGLLAKFLPLPYQFLEDAKFSKVVRQVEATMREASKWQDYFGWEVFKPLKEQGQEPFCPFGFDYKTLPAPWQTGPLRWIIEEQEVCLERFKVSLSCQESSQGMQVILHYDQQWFAQEDMRRLLGHWQTVLQQVLVSADVTVEALQLLTHEERHQMLLEWNMTQVDYPQGVCLHQLFEEQVKRTPESVALTFEDEVLTYAELNRWANQLAHYLQGLGIGPDKLVGICMERCIELVVGLLGVLKAGGAYIPLDPSYPKERLAFMVQDAHLSVLLTQRQLQKQLPLVEAHVIVLERVWEKLVCEPHENPMSMVSPENLAYVIYTSGSTGVPKGVLVPHANVHRLFTRTQAWFQFHAQDIWTLFHSSAFDFSVWEIWGALLHGGRLVIVPTWVSRSPDLFSRLLIDQQVTVLNQTPSAFRLLMQVEEVNQTLEDLALRLVIFGGEPLDLASLQPWIKRHGDQQPHLINMYGITETTVHVTSRLLTQTDVIGATGSLIGRAIPDLQLYILDKYQRLVPIGVPGELHVGGLGLARGYWHRPELTAERFVPHPWSQEPGARLYRTGDLVRYHSDGNLEYLGRVDQQVKIRGYRIELGEIETILMRYPGIREAVVLAREDVHEDKCLVAYIVGEGSKRLVADELHRHLQEKLPDYMIPAFFVLLNALPLTPNGKVDRRALPTPEGRGDGTDDWVAARTQVEEVVLAIYREILGVEQISIHDSFFDRGGHSLLAIQVISRIRSVMGVELSVHSLFETPSVAGLAKQIEQKLRSGQARAMPPLVPVAREQDLPLSFAQQRLWFQEQLVSGHSAYVLPLTVRLDGPLHVAILEKCLQELVHRHESLRTTFVPRLGQPAQVIHSYLHVELTVIDLQAVEEDKQFPEVLQFLSRELLHPFDLNNGPLLRMGLLRLQDQDHILCLVIHHIIFDGWSTGIFFHELSILYEAFLQGKPSPLLPLALQYADFALWQRQWLQGEVLDTLINYWTKQLRGAVPLEMPTDRPRAASMSNRGAIHPFTLSSHLWQKLITLSRQEGVTLFMTLLTAFQILLYRSTGQQDIVVGTDSADRTATEMEQMIGFFVNLLALRVRLSSQATFRETVRSVCATVLGAYTHQNLPFEKLVDALQLERNPHQIPLVNVLFVLQNTPQQLPELSGLTVSPVDVEIHTAKFDIAVFLMERAQDIIGYVNYRTDLFHLGSIARLCLHFKTLLESIVASPDVPLERLEMFTEDEKEQKSSEEATHQEMLRRELKVTKRHMITLPNEVL